MSPGRGGGTQVPRPALCSPKSPPVLQPGQRCRIWPPLWILSWWRCHPRGSPEEGTRLGHGPDVPRVSFGGRVLAGEGAGAGLGCRQAEGGRERGSCHGNRK